MNTRQVGHVMMQRAPIILFAAALFLVGCADPREKEAEQLYARANQYLESDRYEQGIKVLQTIRIEFEDTTYADRAEAEISEYENLQDLRLQNIRRKIHDRFSQIGMALENYRTRFLAYPLTPKDLEKLPTFVVPDWDDYWGNQVYYTPTYSSSDLPAHSPDGYALATFGEDGLPGGNGPDQDHFYKSGMVVASLTK